MRNLLQRLFRKPRNTGAIEDQRPQAEQEKDYRLDEIVKRAAATPWEEKPQETWKRYPVRDQDGSSSCVAQTVAKMAGIMRQQQDGEGAPFIDFSATSIYRRRKNRDWQKNNQGMWGQDAFNIWKKDGITLESLLPSQDLNEAQINSQPEEKYEEDIGKVFRASNYVALPTRDIEIIASTIHKTGKPVMVWYRFHYNEWVNVPEVKNPNPPLHHSVTAVDFTLYKGKRALIIEDSWGINEGIKGQRIVTEDFHNERNTYAAYTINLRNTTEDRPEKPQHRFTRNLEYSPVYNEDPEVEALQDILKYEGLFPTNVDSTGYYGSITARHVLAFQHKHGVPDDGLEGKLVGVKTRKKLNELYG